MNNNSSNDTDPKFEPTYLQQSSNQPNERQQKIWNLIRNISDKEPAVSNPTLESVYEDSLLTIGIFNAEATRLLQLIILSYRDPTVQAIAIEVRDEIAVIISILAENPSMKHKFLGSRIRPLCYATFEGSEPKTEVYETVRRSEFSHDVIVQEGTANCEDEIFIQLKQWSSSNEAAKRIHQMLRKMVTKIDQILAKHDFGKTKSINLPFSQLHKHQNEKRLVKSHPKKETSKILTFQIFSSIAEVATTTTTILQAHEKLEGNAKFRMYFFKFPYLLSEEDLKAAIMWNGHQTGFGDDRKKRSPFELAIRWQRNSVLMQIILIPGAQEWESLEDKGDFDSRYACKRAALEIINRLSMTRTVAFTTVERARLIKQMAKFSSMHSKIPARKRNWEKLASIIKNVINDLPWSQSLKNPSYEQDHHDLFEVLLDRCNAASWAKESSILGQKTPTVLSSQSSQDQVIEFNSEGEDDSSTDSTGMEPCAANRSSDEGDLRSETIESDTNTSKSKGSTGKTRYGHYDESKNKKDKEKVAKTVLENA